MASSKSEKIEALIYLLRKHSEGLETLAIHGETQRKVHKALPQIDVDYAEKDVGDWTNADYEAYWKKTGLEVQEAKNEIGAIGVDHFVGLFRDNISSAIVELEDFIIRNSRKWDDFCHPLPETGKFRDNLLRHIQSTVCESTDPDDIKKLIRHLIVVRQRSEVRPTQGQTDTKEQTWDKNNPDYMGTTEAVKDAKDKGRKTSVPSLSRKLTSDGHIRYMRKYTKTGKPSRSKVHIGDFRDYLKTLPLIDDAFSEEAFKERQSEIKDKKKTQGQSPGQDEGYNKLAKKILKQ